MLDFYHRIAFDLSLILPGALLIGLRLWVRNKNRLPNPALVWYLSDVFLILALAIGCSVVGLDVNYLRKRIKLEQHAKEDFKGIILETQEVTVNFLKVSLFNQYAYITALWSVKASFLCSYYTMSGHLSKRLRTALNYTGVLLLLTWLGLVFGFTFWCRPIQRNWSLYASYFCSPQAKTEQAVLVYVLHIGTDIPIMSIPFFIIHTLVIGRGERYAIAFMFLLGFMTAVSSTFSFVLHLQFIHLDHISASSALLQEKLEGIYLSACAEVWGAVFIVCLPSTRLALRWLFKTRPPGEKSTTTVGDEPPSISIELGPPNPFSPRTRERFFMESKRESEQEAYKDWCARSGHVSADLKHFEFGLESDEERRWRQDCELASEDGVRMMPHAM